MKLGSTVNVPTCEFTTPVPKRELSDALTDIIEVLKETFSVQNDTCMLLAKEGDGADVSNPECLLEAVDVIERMAHTVRAKAYQIHRIVK